MQTTVTSCDHAKVTVPWTMLTLDLAGFQLLTEASNGRQPEFKLIGQYFIHGIWLLISRATIVAFKQNRTELYCILNSGHMQVA